MAGAEKIKNDTGLTIEKARELLGDNKEISDEKLQEIIQAVKLFCQLSYELYSGKQTGTNNTIIPLYKEGKKAA